MRIDQKEIRSALVAVVEADKSETLLGTPSDKAIEIVRLALATEHDIREVSISNGQSSMRFADWAAPILLRRVHYRDGIDDALAWLDRVASSSAERLLHRHAAVGTRIRTGS